MHLFRAIPGIYVNGSFHVSAVLVSLVAYTAMLSGLEVPAAYYGALFFGSVAGYNCIKYGAEPWKSRPKPGGQIRLIFWLSLLCLGISLFFLSKLPLRYWWMLAGCGGLAALYALPVLPGFRNLRSFGLVKVPLVALIWVATSLWIPVWGTGNTLGWDLGWEGQIRFIWICLLMLPFEIRDMEYDPPSLRTLPRRWGVSATRWVGWCGAVLFFLMVGLKQDPGGCEWTSKGAAALMTGLAVQFSRRRQGPYFASFWVEGIPAACLAVHWVCFQLAGP